MSSVEGKEYFRNYYSNFLKHSEEIEKRKSEIIDSLTKTFDALGSMNKEIVKPLVMKEKTISIHQIGPRELKIFTEFTKKFLKENAMDENQVESLREKITEAREALEKINTRTMLEDFLGQKKSSVIKNLKTAEDQILLHEKVEDRTEDPPHLVTKTINHVNRLFKEEQKKALEIEKKLSKVQKQIKIADAISIGLMGIGFLGIFIAPIAGAVVLGMAIVVIGLGSVFLGVVKFPTFGLLYFKGNKVQEEFNSAMVKLEKFESYKKFLKNEESFNDFALKNRYAEFEKDPEKFMQFMDLYVLEQKYDLERLESNRKIEDGNLIGLETISRLIERHFKEINVLRVSLGLDPLIRKPKFIED